MSARAEEPAAPYRQIAADLRRQIMSEELGRGERLPSARALMEQYGVATQTVQNAFRMLRAEGLTYSVQGRGTFVREDLDLSQLPGEDEPTGEYLDVMEQLGAMSEAIEKLDERVAQLEKEQSSAKR